MYYIWNSEKTLFVVAGDTTKNTFYLTKKYYKDNIQPSIEEWRLLTLPLGIGNAPQAVVDYFVSNIIKNLKKRDIHIAIDIFDYKNNQNIQILNDVLYCINENCEEYMIEFNESLDKEFSSINVYALEGTWKSEFTKKKADKKVAKLIRSVGVSQISSFVANSDKITMKLKSNSYFNLGYGDFNNEYDSLLQSYIFK